MASRQLVIFNVAGESFGVEITQVDSIINPLEIFKVPNTPDFIEGLINLRGKVYTVFNLRKRFCFPSEETGDSSKIIIVKLDTAMAGFLVDEVNEIVTFDENDIENTPQAIANLDRKYLSGVAKKGEKIILMLDLTRVLSASEQEETLKVEK